MTRAFCVCAIAISQGWNGCWNKTQHKKSDVSPGEENSPASLAVDRTHNLPITSLTLYHQATSIPLRTAMKSNTTPKTAFHGDKCPSFSGWAYKKGCTVIPNSDQVFHFSPAPFIIPSFTKESTAGHTSYSGWTFDQVCNVRYILFIARHTFLIM